MMDLDWANDLRRQELAEVSMQRLGVFVADRAFLVRGTPLCTADYKQPPPPLASKFP